MKEILKLYKEKEESIKKRLDDFKSLNESKYFKEFMFCLLTPQSNAQKCWNAVESISLLPNPKKEEILEILRTKTRFYKTKAERIIKANEMFSLIEPHLKKEGSIELRNFISESVNGYGLKEAAHFLRNIGKSNNKVAILDRHILRNLKSLGAIESDKIKSKKDYLKIEQDFLKFSEKVGIPIDELDLLFWSKENGEIFK